MPNLPKYLSKIKKSALSAPTAAKSSSSIWAKSRAWAWRVINGENIAYASTNDLDYANLLSIAQKTAQAAQGDCEEVTLDFSYPLTHQSQAVIRPESIALEDKIAQIKACDQAALNTDENITRTSVSYSDITQNVLIASTAGASGMRRAHPHPLIRKCYRSGRKFRPDGL